MMKIKLVLLLLLFTIIISANEGNGLFPSTTINLGELSGTRDSCVANFRYKNCLGKTVVIENVFASCSCTKVQYPHKPIENNDTGRIRVAINLRNEKGYFKKKVVVYASGIKPTILKIEGNVK